MAMSAREAWPQLPYGDCAPTMETLQLMTQFVGKVRLAQTPWINHAWHVTLYVSARGLRTGLIPAGAVGFELEFDLIDHALVIQVSDGGQGRVALETGAMADFYGAVVDTLARLGVAVVIDVVPNELPDPTPFPDDRVIRPYDGEMAGRFWRALVQIERVFVRFRSRFIGKCSPVHLFWGSFDLAVTRFSGRPAPLHPGGVPHLPDAVTREAYSHEVSSAGFWPGGGGVTEAAFYSYSYPTPAGFGDAPVTPDAAYFDKAMGEFILPYEAVRTAPDPDVALLAFLQSTYESAATTANWDRTALEIEEGQVGRPRIVS